MGIDKVSADKFYMDDGDKTKQNWFLYEYSNIMFSKIAESPQLMDYRKKHDEGGIADFCVYFSKRLRLSIYNLNAGKVNGVVIDARYVYEFYPGNPKALTQRLLAAAEEAWKEHVAACINCPNRCIEDGLEMTAMFDNLKKAGWPT